jgi:hypothetical protein
MEVKRSTEKGNENEEVLYMVGEKGRVHRKKVE